MFPARTQILPSKGKTLMRPSLVSFNEIAESADREWEDLEDDGLIKLTKG